MLFLKMLSRQIRDRCLYVLVIIEVLLQLVSASDHETDDDPDGVYAFRRKAGCHYHTVSVPLECLVYKCRYVVLNGSYIQF